MRMPFACDDAPHTVAKQFYRDRDAAGMVEFARANRQHPWVQIEAAHLASELKQPRSMMHYLGAALKADPRAALGSWFYWHMLAAAMAQLGDQGEGEASAGQAVKMAPKQALLWSTYAAYAFQRGDVQEGYHRLSRCIECPAGTPEDVKAQGEALLFLGQWKEGWQKWEARTLLKSITNHFTFAAAEWKGERLVGKNILVWGEQGAGDQVQFLRFLPLLKMRGARINLRVMPSLLPWASALETQGIVDEIGGEGEITGMDYHVALLSLPHKLHRQHPKDWPAPWAPPIPRNPVKGRIGYSWRGNPDHGNDHDRSHPERAEFEWQLGKTDDWVNLTGGDAGSPQGWLETAAVIATCERVITVDTAIAHVSGSLGVPTTTMLAAAPEWRWCKDYTDSTPWYPSMRLVRKRYIGGWNEALASARETLDGR